MDIIEYRRISQMFRRVASNMLTTKYDDGNVHLIRFRKFIQENEIIDNIIQEKIQGIDYKYEGNFIVEDSGWSSMVIPTDESEHIKAMYEYLVDITSEQEDIRWRAHKFYHSSGKWNDIIREYLDKAFKPLVDFIVDSLSMEMIGMEPAKQETHIHQNINTNYGTAAIAQRDINSVNNANTNNIGEIRQLLDSLKELILTETIKEEIKEEIIDDLETIEEEIQNEQPKGIRIKKAYQRVKDFIYKIPEGISKATAITTAGIELYEKLRPFIEK